jgi:hypothetical protein
MGAGGMAGVAQTAAILQEPERGRGERFAVAGRHHHASRAVGDELVDAGTCIATIGRAAAIAVGTRSSAGPSAPRETQHGELAAALRSGSLPIGTIVSGTRPARRTAAAAARRGVVLEPHEVGPRMARGNARRRREKERPPVSAQPGAADHERPMPDRARGARRACRASVAREVDAVVDDAHVLERARRPPPRAGAPALGIREHGRRPAVDSVQEAASTALLRRVARTARHDHDRNSGEPRRQWRHTPRRPAGWRARDRCRRGATRARAPESDPARRVAARQRRHRDTERDRAARSPAPPAAESA